MPRTCYQRSTPKGPSGRKEKEARRRRTQSLSRTWRKSETSWLSKGWSAKSSSKRPVFYLSTTPSISARTTRATSSPASYFFIYSGLQLLVHGLPPPPSPELCGRILKENTGLHQIIWVNGKPEVLFDWLSFGTEFVGSTKEFRRAQRYYAENLCGFSHPEYDYKKFVFLC